MCVCVRVCVSGCVSVRASVCVCAFVCGCVSMCAYVCVRAFVGVKRGNGMERVRKMGKNVRVGWAFVSVALHTLNQVSMSHSVVGFCLEVLGWGGWRFYVGEGETGVTNLFACTLFNNVLPVTGGQRVRVQVVLFVVVLWCCVAFSVGVLVRPVIRGVPYRISAYRILAYRVLAYRFLAYRILAFRILAWRQISVPLISRPVARYRRGGTSPMWSLASISICQCCLLLWL